MNRKLVCLLLAALLCLGGCTPKEKKDDAAKNPPEHTPWIELTKLEGILRKQKDKADEDVEEMSVGVVEGNTYTNAAFGFGFTVDEDWTVLPAEELQDLTESAEEAFSGSELGDYLAVTTQFMDVSASNGAMDLQINVVFEKTPAILQNYLNRLTEEEYIDMMLSRQELLIEAYEQAGIEVVDLSKRTVSFLGEPRCALYTEATMYGIPYYILQFLDISSGEYVMSLTIGSLHENHVEELLPLFFAA